MRSRTTAMALALLGLLAVTGCTDDDPANAAADATASPQGEVPDPCTLVGADAISELTGSDPGPGTVKGLVPEQRKVCVFSSGLSLAVEIGEDYEPTVEAIRTAPSGASIEEVAGVGLAAIWQDFGGGVGQLVARGEAYFVGVTVAAGGQEVGQAVAAALLEQL